MQNKGIVFEWFIHIVLQILMFKICRRFNRLMQVPKTPGTPRNRRDWAISQKLSAQHLDPSRITPSPEETAAASQAKYLAFETKITNQCRIIYPLSTMGAIQLSPQASIIRRIAASPLSTIGQMVKGAHRALESI